jgi:hypothetical protein
MDVNAVIQGSHDLTFTVRPSGTFSPPAGGLSANVESSEPPRSGIVTLP